MHQGDENDGFIGLDGRLGGAWRDRLHTSTGVIKVLEFIEKYGCSAISIKQLEDVSGMSRRNLERAFMKHSRTTPTRLLLQFRMERAKSLLLHSEFHPDTLARMTGYASAKTFGAAFRRYTGLNIRQFRKQPSATRNFRT
jgi:transcriptional regulator GlxA family with amidase domain